MKTFHDYQRHESPTRFIKQREDSSKTYDSRKSFRLKNYDVLPFDCVNVFEVLTDREYKIHFPYPVDNNYEILVASHSAQEELNISIINLGNNNDRVFGRIRYNKICRRKMKTSEGTVIDLSKLSVYFNSHREDEALNNIVANIFTSAEIVDIQHNFPRIEIDDPHDIFYKIVLEDIKGGKKEMVGYIENEDKYIQLIEAKTKKYHTGRDYILTIRNFKLNYNYCSESNKLHIIITFFMDYHNIEEYYAYKGAGYMIAKEHFKKII